MSAIAFRTAIRDALDEELEADERVILFGEDIAVAGGVFATTPGLYDKYGPDRVCNTPIPYSPPLGEAFLPGADRIAEEIRRHLR
jgi:pyruvate/2-oxoglutarate/acetoin dehydrogenase E1 component